MNAVSCLAFGLLFALFLEPVRVLLGSVPAGLLQVIGILLIVNGVHLAFASARERLRQFEVLYFSAGDILWFIGCVALVGANVYITTGVGQMAAIVVALGVLGLGLAQVWLLAEASGTGVPSPTSTSTLRDDLMPAGISRVRAIAVSWRSVKPWIHTWLFALNAVFLGALTLAAYVASGPLLAAMMIWQRGLTRLLGLAHLIPWLPLVGYLGLRLTSDAVGPIITRTMSPALYTYTVVLLAAVVISLGFDAYDCLRWWRGERFRLGSKNAAASGASIMSLPG